MHASQDLRVAGLALDNMKSCVLVANKCDLLDEHGMAKLTEKVACCGDPNQESYCYDLNEYP